MRIRSIRPEFWTSDDIASLTWDQRLIYIGLWSYVDDNGVGRDVAKLIAADLFPLEDDAAGVLTKIHGALSEYSSRQMITRYEVAGKRFLHINAWSEHQKINRPSDGRYPLPTREDAVISEPSVSPHANVPLGEGEKGRRGEGEKVKTSSTASAIDGEFHREFWPAYPRKVAKGAALKAYRAARAKIPHDRIMSSLAVFVRAQRGQDANFIPHAATWLNQGRWDDNPEDIAPPRTNGHQRETDDIFERMLSRAPEAQRGITA